jgi:hypothetical protein
MQHTDFTAQFPVQTGTHTHKIELKTGQNLSVPLLPAPLIRSSWPNYYSPCSLSVRALGRQRPSSFLHFAIRSSACVVNDTDKHQQQTLVLLPALSSSANSGQVHARLRLFREDRLSARTYISRVETSPENLSFTISPTRIPLFSNYCLVHHSSYLKYYFKC